MFCQVFSPFYSITMKADWGNLRLNCGVQLLRCCSLPKDQSRTKPCVSANGREWRAPDSFLFFSFFFSVWFLVICKTEKAFPENSVYRDAGKSWAPEISQSVTMPFTCAECFALLFHPSFCSFRKHKQHKLDYFDIAKFICTACLSHMVAPQDNAWL